jgi:hypothetical protein
MSSPSCSIEAYVGYLHQQMNQSVEVPLAQSGCGCERIRRSSAQSRAADLRLEITLSRQLGRP